MKDGKVWHANGSGLEEVAVKTGIKTIKAIEVTEGVSDDDTVVADATQPLKAGQRIRPKLDDWQAK